MPLRMSIAGIGHWHAPRHIDSFTAAGATVVAVHDDEADVAKTWGERLGCRVAPGLDELIDEDVDLVLAMPRHRDGPAVVARLIERGLPFVVEKPVAASAAELWPQVLAAEAKGQFAAVPFINRYSTFWDHLARVQAGGLLAPPCVARFRIVNGPPSRYVDDGVAWALDPEIGGGGALRNLGPHTVDAFLSLAEGQVSVAGAVLTDRQYGMDVEEHAIAVLRDDAGLIGVVEVGYSGPHHDGTDHEWALVGPGSSVRELHSTVGVITQEGQADFASPPVMQRYRIFAEDVVERLRARRPAPVTLRDAWRALEVVDRIYDAA
ncbi:Gfo/Idh/MocA family protein, partial [Phytoactinopolyspora endophytica]|uniref:Gfo/Idh/MocA family protein n=1 Tax=Phytoactinopolyspora endophytica TaxID=1642495 RepID=UPI001F102C80